MKYVKISSTNMKVIPRHNGCRIKTIIIPRELNFKIIYILGQWRTLRLLNEDFDIVYQYLIYKGFRDDDLDIVDNIKIEDKEGYINYGSSIRIKKDNFNVK